MTPEEQLHALRSDERWEATTLAPRAILPAAASLHERGRLAPAVITAVVAIVVAIASIGLIRLVDEHGRSAPAATVSPTVAGATATIRGTAATSVRTIAGVGRPGGPSTPEIVRLQAIAKQTGRLVGQPSTSPSNDVRLQSAVTSVLAAFKPAVHDLGGTGPKVDVFFLVLNRAPTAQELQLLRLLPFTVRVSWGPRLGVRERDREQQAAFASVKGVYDAFGDTAPETDTLELSFWPDRDHPKSAADMARQLASTITKLTGKAPTYSIEVTDESKTAVGQAALRATGRAKSDDGVRLLIADRPTGNVDGTGIGNADHRFEVNPQHCVTLGGAVIIAPPGSSISADGLTVSAKGVGTYPVAPADPTRTSSTWYAFGGARIDARSAATFLRRGSTLCGATEFILLQK